MEEKVEMKVSNGLGVLFLNNPKHNVLAFAVLKELAEKFQKLKDDPLVRAIIFDSKSDVVFSTGAEIAIPVAVIGKLFFRARLMHMETAVHPRKVSLTGKLLAPLCDRFYVQWPEAVAAVGGKAAFAGRVF